jgi:hypothetical protein
MRRFNMHLGGKGGGGGREDILFFCLPPMWSPQVLTESNSQNIPQIPNVFPRTSQLHLNFDPALFGHSSTSMNISCKWGPKRQQDYASILGREDV